MYTIKVYAELHWAIQRPDLEFYIDDCQLTADITVVDRDKTVEKVIYTMPVDQQAPKQLFKICLVNKRDELNTAESEHWVHIKNVIIDGVPIDWMLFKYGVFKHSMSKEWVEDMLSQGYDIQPEYCPGTEMRLNGEFHYEITHPFIITRVLTEWRDCHDVKY